MNSIAVIITDDDKVFTKQEEIVNSLEPDLPVIQGKNPGIDPEYEKRKHALWTKLLFEKSYERVILISPELTLKGSFLKDIPKDGDVYALNYGIYQIPPNTPMATVWGIHPLKYAHLRFAVITSKRFSDLWFRLCMSEHLNYYPRYELDLFNILLQYGDFDVRYPNKPQLWQEISIP